MKEETSVKVLALKINYSASICEINVEKGNALVYASIDLETLYYPKESSLSYV